MATRRTKTTTAEDTLVQGAHNELRQAMKRNETREGTSTGRNTKMAKAAEQEIMDSATDGIEVVRADGTTTTVGSFDPDEDTTEVAPVTKQNGRRATGTKATASKGKATAKTPTQKLAPGASAAERRRAEKAEREAAALRAKLQAEKDKAKQAREDAKAQAKADREKAAADRKAERERIAAEKAQAKADAKAEREAARNRSKWETGDPEKDAAFHEAEAKAQTLALVPADPSLIRAPFLSIDGVHLHGMGVTLPENMPAQQWVDMAKGFATIRDVAGFALGDTLVYGETLYGRQYKKLVGDLGLADSTIRNYKQVAAAWEIDERVPGVGFYPHLYVTPLKRVNPTAARNLLQQMVDEKHNEPWLKQKLIELRTEGAIPAGHRAGTGSTQRNRASILQEIIDTPIEDFEDGLADLPTEAQVSRREEQVAAVFADAAANTLVSAPQVQSALQFLTQRNAELQAERDEWMARAIAAENRLAELGERQERVSGHADPLAFLGASAPEGEVIDGEARDVTGETDLTELTDEQLDDLAGDEVGADEDDM